MTRSVRCDWFKSTYHLESQKKVLTLIGQVSVCRSKTTLRSTITGNLIP